MNTRTPSTASTLIWLTGCLTLIGVQTWAAFAGQTEILIAVSAVFLIAVVWRVAA